MFEADALPERLRTQVKRMLESVWERRADLKDVDDWLGQFDAGPDDGGDRLQAFFLLSQFMYFGSFEVRALLKALYRDHFRYPIVARIRETHADTTDLRMISSLFETELAATRFVGLGNPSESSSHLLYYFRQENELPKDLFVGPAEIFHFAAVEDGFVQVIRDDSVANYVLIDDLCGSGRQAEGYSANIAAPIRRLAANAGLQVRISYVALFATSDGLGHVRDIGQFDEVDCVVELDPSFKCFSEGSRYYANEQAPISRAAAEEMCRRHGALLSPEHPLGFDDGQLLLAFSHNTPDNTLPIFSFDDPRRAAWTPLFKRYAKVGA
jgi:hypothetical protein